MNPNETSSDHHLPPAPPAPPSSRPPPGPPPMRPSGAPPPRPIGPLAVSATSTTSLGGIFAASSESSTGAAAANGSNVSMMEVMAPAAAPPASAPPPVVAPPPPRPPITSATMDDRSNMDTVPLSSDEQVAVGGVEAEVPLSSVAPRKNSQFFQISPLRSNNSNRKAPPQPPPANAAAVVVNNKSNGEEEVVTNPTNANADNYGSHRPQQQQQQRGSQIKDKQNIPNPGGLTSVTKENCEIPSELLQRSLLKDEIVTAQFDSFYPHCYNTLPSPRYEFYLALFSLGLYWLIKVLSHCWTMIRRSLFGGCVACRDQIQFTRGKVLLTNKGRVLWWKQGVSQVNSCLDQRTFHSIQSTLEVLHVDDLSSISLRYSDQHLLPCPLCRCCRDFEVGVDLTFFRYDYKNDRSTCCSTASVSAFANKVNGRMFDAFQRRLFDTNNQSSRATTMTTVANSSNNKPLTITLLSNNRDHVYNGEFGLESLEDLTIFQAEVANALSNNRAAAAATGATNRNKNNNSASFLSPRAMGLLNHNNNSNNNHNNTDNHNSGGGINANQQTVISSSSSSTAAVDDNKGFNREFSISRSSNDMVLLPGVREVNHQDLHGFCLVDDDNMVTIPLRWMPLSLSSNEEILGAAGQRYRPSMIEFLLTFITFGLSYLCYTRVNRMESSAIVLTTHRIILLTLKSRRHKITADMADVDFTVRSLLVGEVAAGSIESLGSRLKVLLLTSFGSLEIDLSADQLAFAQRLQLATTRSQPLPFAGPNDLEVALLPDLLYLEGGAVGEKGGESKQRHHEEGHFVRKAGRRRSMPIGAAIDYDSKSGGAAGGGGGEMSLSLREQGLLPLIAGETVLHRFNGGGVYMPLSYYSWFLSLFMQDSIHQPKCWSFVTLIRMLTCNFLPRVSAPTLVVSDHSLFFVTQELSLHELYLMAEAAADVELGGTSYDNNTAVNDVNAGTKTGPVTKSEADPYCGWFGGPSQRLVLEPFFIAWVPVRSISRHRVSVASKGAKPLSLNCCLCLPQKARSFQSRYILQIDTQSGIVFPLAEDLPFKSWIKDYRLSKLSDVLAALQLLAKAK